MKVVSRQPICITRLKKKQSSHLLPPSAENSLCRDPRPQLHELSQNAHGDPKDSLPRTVSRQFGNGCESQGYLQKENVQTSQNYSALGHDEELLKRIRELETANEQLACRNRELAMQLGSEQAQKMRLYSRIDKLQKQFARLESQFQQQQRLQVSKVQVPRAGGLELRFNTPKPREQMERSSDLMGYRRLSFHQSAEYKSQDLSNKVREYRNQLEMERIRRLNLERELSNCKENTKLELKNEIAALEHKLENYREALTRKDKEIGEKEELIQRHILRR